MYSIQFIIYWPWEDPKHHLQLVRNASLMRHANIKGGAALCEMEANNLCWADKYGFHASIAQATGVKWH